MKPRVGAKRQQRRFSPYSTIAALLATLACGCSDFQPLTSGDFVSIVIRGGDHGSLPVIDNVVYGGLVLASIGREDARVHWGQPFDRSQSRVVDSTYDPDTIILEEEFFGTLYLPRDPDGSSDWAVPIRDATPGREFSITVNEFTEPEITMPTSPPLIEPNWGSEYSVSSGDDLLMKWEPWPTPAGDWMIWYVLRGSSYELGDPCRDVVWSPDNEGPLEDTGQFAIPRDAFPTGLPESGCRANVGILVVRAGTLGPSITGRLIGEQYYHNNITLLP